MYVNALTGKSKGELDALLFDKAARRNHTDPYDEKRYRGARIEEVKGGRRLAKIGWHSLKNKVYCLSITSRRY